MQLTHSPSPPIYPYQTYRLFLLPRLTIPSLPYLYIPFSLRHRATPSSRSLFSLSFLCILALASNHHSPSPSPISTLSYSFLLFARSRPLSLSVPLSLPLFDSTGLSILSGATFNPLPYSPSPRPCTPFFPLFSDRYIACRPVRRYHTVHPRNIHTPHLDHPRSPTSGR